MRPASKTPTALVLIDVQEGFKHPTHWGNSRSTPAFEHNVEAILRSFREYNSTAEPNHQALIIHVLHYSTTPTSVLHPSHFLEGSSIPSVTPQPYAAPIDSELVITKNVNSSFIGTTLEATLRSAGIRQLVLVGLTADHCVSTTARMAANLQVLGDAGGPDGNGEGVNGVLLVRDAIATYEKGGFDAETVHAVSLASLSGEFGEVVEAEGLTKTVLGLDLNPSK